NDFWEYDPAENRWYRKKNYPREVHFAVGFAIGGKGYVGAGLIAQEINTPCADYPVSPNFHEFDPNAGPIDNETGVPEGTWTQKASTPQGESDHPPSCRVSSRAVGFALEISPGNWKGYIAGGADSNLYEFDPDAGNIDPQTGLPTGEWKGWASTGVVWPTPENLRESMTVFTIGNSAYLGLGRSDTNGDLLAEFWKLEPGEDYRWTRLADFGGTPRELATGFAIGKKGYAGTGQNFQDLADFWEYTPEEN
ncbi:MAG: hypothetical protein KDD06_28145, partial [Phaeodactylibacter sp.]|nr:hypothetical protein [Phaeodactylibacter sp.]